MGVFDWNNDGKQDWHDDALFHTVINKDSSSDDDEFPTLGKGSSGYSRSSNNRSSAPQRDKGISSDAACLIAIVIVVTLFLCISALCMGYGGIVGDLLGFGALAFVVVYFSAR